jgi:hypothetical protein
MNLSQLTDILLDLKISIDNHKVHDIKVHMKRLEQIGLEIQIKNKEIINSYRPKRNTPEREKR